MRPRIAPALAFGLSLAALLASQGALESQDAPPPPRLGAELEAAVARASRSAVLVEVTGGSRRPEAIRRDLFQDPESGPLGSSRESGVGVVISADGLILTHAALVPFTRPTILVTTTTERLSARVVARSAAVDAVLLKVEPSAPLEPAPRRGTPPLQGELALAFGNPFKVGRDGKPAVSMGIVGALTSLDARESGYEGDMILLDAAINPGSYGGPVFDRRGELLGIAAPLLKSQRSGALLRAAQPAGPVLAALKDAMAPPRPRLGLVVGVGNPIDGLKVTAVQPLSPAAEAGLQAGDRLRKFGERDIRGADDLAAALAEAAPGDEVLLTIARGDSVEVLKVVLGGPR